MEELKKQNKSVVLRSALGMAFGTFSSRILGLVRDMAFAALFSRTITDAWMVAFRLPNMFRRILGEGSLAVSFIPIFVEAQNDNAARARNLMNGLYTILLLILTVFTTLGIVYMEPLLGLLVSGKGFTSVPGKLELTLRMARIMFGFIFLMSTYAYFMAILNAFHKFALAAIAPCFFNIAMIISTFLPVQWFSSIGDGVAWGVIAGGILQSCSLVPALYRLGFLPRLNWREIWNPDVRRVLRNMIPSMLGLGMVQITGLVNIQFASRLGEGSHSWIYWADRILELPLSLFAVSMGTALLPTLSAQWAKGDKVAMSETSNWHSRLTLAVAFPSALGLWIFSVPIVDVLYRRGGFQARDVEMTAMILKIYSVLLIFSSLVRVIVPAFYAMKNTWLPALAGAIGLVSHLMVAPVLIEKIGLTGIAASSVISAAINLGVLVVSFYWMIGPLQGVKFLTGAFRLAVAGLVMFIFAKFYFLLELKEISRWIQGGTLFLFIGLSGAIYFVVAAFLGAPEIKAILQNIWGKVRRRIEKSQMENSL